jgi:RNA polymerase sigma-70 factor, ECF subfamily
MTMAAKEILKDQNDSALIQRYAEGERDAFGELYKKYHRRLAGYCFRLLQDRTKTQDVVQTVFAKALESIQSLEKPELFYYWLFTIARNEVYSLLRRTRSNGTVELTEDVWDSETPHESMVRKETILLVEEGLNRLKAEYREVLILRQFEQLSYSEIAAITGDTISSVESRLFKARKALLIQLKPYLERGDSHEL